MTGLLVAAAWAQSLPVAQIKTHTLAWDSGASKYVHDHALNCETNNNFNETPYNFNWEHSTSSGYLHGNGRDASFLMYTYCYGSNAAIERGPQAYRNAGVLFSERTVPCPSVLKPNGTFGWTPWYGNFQANGDYVFEDRHGIYWVDSDMDPLYTKVIKPMGKERAGTFIFAKELVGGPGPTGPTMAWHIYLNDVDYTFLQFHPSTIAHLQTQGGIYFTDVVMHELLHVLGAGHVSSQSLKQLFPSAIQATNTQVGKTSHLGLEANARLYPRDGLPVPGTYYVPPADQIFLDDHYGVRGLNWDRIRMHPWEAESDGLGNYVFENCGWEASVNMPHYPYDFTQAADALECVQNDFFSAADIQAIDKVLPQFTSTEERDLRLRLYAVSDDADPGNAEPGCPNQLCQSHLDVIDEWHLTVPAGGSWSFDAATGAPLQKVNIDTNHPGPGGYYIQALYYIDVLEDDGNGNLLPVPGMVAIPLNAMNAVGNCVEG